MNLIFKIISFIICINGLSSTRTVFAMETKITEAQQIALESSGELLPPENLANRIEKDLLAIRSKYPEVANVHHTNKFVPGKLIISNVKKEGLEKIQSSSYGPVDAKPIFQDTIYVLQFKKPYNPVKLAGLLKNELGIDGAEPDGVIGGSSGITLSSSDNGVNTYVFFIGSGDCPAGCINKRYLTFTVDSEQKSVQLIKDTGNNS